MALLNKETIRAEIERLRDEYTDIAIDSHYGAVNANHVVDDLEQLLSLLDTLPEQPVIKKSNALFDECVKNCDPAVMKEVSDNVDKILGKQPMEGLEEEISRTYHDGSVTDTEDIDHTAYENIARHFAEWGAEHLKK